MFAKLTPGLPAILLTGLIAGSALAAPKQDADLCTGEKPDAVLDCLSTAFAAHDSVAYEHLLAPGFRFVLQDGGGWSRDEDLAHTRLLFEKDIDLSLSIGDGYEILEGTDPGTWTLRNVPLDLVIVERENGKKYEVHQPVEKLVVRRVAEPVPHFQIVTWKQSKGGE